MVGPTITDPFFRRLHAKLVEELQSRINALASGSALTLGKDVGVDAVATAINYTKAITYIETIQQVIDLGVELDHEQYGGKRPNGEE